MEEKFLLNLIAEILKCRDKLNVSEIIKDDKRLGFHLTYFLNEQMTQSKDFESTKIWLDNVEWSSLVIGSNDEIQGKGKLWWGYRSNFDKMFSNDFLCHLELFKVSEKVEFKYIFKFQINSKEYLIKS